MRLFAALFVLVVLSGCLAMGDRLAELRAKQPGREDFPQALAAEYLAYAEALSEEGHPLKADYFAKKGLAALGGDIPPPEESAALAESRQALLEVLTPDIEDIAPAKAARAQLLFDCSVAKENLCKASFAEALADLQFIADALVHGGDNRFSVAFDDGSHRLNDQALLMLDIIARRVSGYGEYQVEIIPASARRGTSVRGQQQQDSLRVLAIEKGLIGRGVDAGRIHAHRKASGKKVTLSTDDAKAQANSVMISIQTYGQSPEVMDP